jgi:demethylmenaquinone methyltransferase/2-methoxy-6-polyprenyl-1,4-benzoquinol methylase
MSAGTLPEGQVRAMFDRIAGVYDAMNSVMTAGMHHRWRRRAIDLAHVGPGSRVLDVATGTGDLAIEARSRGAQVVGSDFSEGMLALARKKVDHPRSGSRAAALEGGAGSITFEQADALALPYEDDSFDAATVGFGARNFSDLQQGLSEMARVVRPGGRVVVLEITTPTRPPLSTFFSLWFDRVVPLVGRVAGDADAYSYLPDSVKRFPAPDDLAATMERAGMRDIHWILTAGGIIAIHAGTVESSP